MTALRGVLPAKDEVALSSRVEEVIQSHVERLVGEPTASFVEGICDDLQPSELREVLFYFLVESPLRVQGMLFFCGRIGAEQVRQVSHNAARMRERRQGTDRKPIWT